jgi:ribonuclease-3
MKETEQTSKLAEFQQIIGYHFQEPTLLKQALTHSSYTGESQNHKDNYERLEFLGDAVLEVLTSEWLYRRYDWPEGKLTRRRAQIVCETSLAYVARKYHFGAYLYMNRGEEKTGGRDRSSILCDVVEAVIGAVYLDSSLEEARKLVENLIFRYEQELPGEQQKDAKSALQELLQAQGKERPEYRILAEEGQPHDRTFVVELYQENQCISTGSGHSKKEAEQAAAMKALEIFSEQSSSH